MSYLMSIGTRAIHLQHHKIISLMLGNQISCSYFLMKYL